MYADGDGGAFDYGGWHDLQVEKEQDIINEYAYDLDRYNTYEDLVSALRGDERLKYEDGDAYYLELASDIIGKGEGYVCDRCSCIASLDDIYAFEYGDPDNENDCLLADQLRHEHLEDEVGDICQDCYQEMLDNAKRRLFHTDTAKLTKLKKKGE